MRIHRDHAILPAAARGASVAIGNFDGVHRGHREVIRVAAGHAAALGRPLGVVTFEPHPAQVHHPEQAVTRNRFQVAKRAAEQTLAEAPSLPRNMWINFRDGLVMVMQILPSIMSVGLIALVLATYTPVFAWVGMIFRPFFWALGFYDPALLSSAAATSVAEMFIPATMVADHPDFVARFVIGVVCVSAIIFFSAVVPAILATDIPVKLWHLLIIWVERVILTILLATPLAHLVAAVAG